jgi:hypothetical protein
MPQVPATDEVSLPGRVLFRSGTKSQISSAALRLGEGAITTDNWNGWLGDESQNPPHWPTSKTVGDFDWTNLNPFYSNINVLTINNKKLGDLFNEYITTGETPVITIINENLTKTVYGTNPDFVDLEAAYAWLSQRTISTLGSVTLVFPVGKITETKSYTINHPNGDRIIWKGKDLRQSLPSASNLQITGYSAAAQANDTAANLALLRQCYSTEIYFTQGGCITFSGNLSLMQNLLITSDGDRAGKDLVIGIGVTGCAVNFYNVTVVGFDYIGFFITNGATCFCTNKGTCIAMGNGGGGLTIATNALMAVTDSNFFSVSNGARHAADFTSNAFAVSDNSLFASYPYYTSTFVPVVFAAGNSGYGAQVTGSSFAGTMTITIRLNGFTGILVNSGSSFRVAGITVTDNNGNGVTCDTFSVANIGNSNISNNSGFGLAAYNGSFIFRGGSNVANNAGSNYSPALGTTGNTNALIA